MRKIHLKKSKYRKEKEKQGYLGKFCFNGLSLKDIKVRTEV